MIFSPIIFHGKKPGFAGSFGSLPHCWYIGLAGLVLGVRFHGDVAWDLPSGYVKIAIENGPVERVNFPMNSMVDLSIVFCKGLPGRVP